MTTRQERGPQGRLLPIVPDSWPGSDPEYYVYRAILRTGRKEGVDFQYQTNTFGGRTQRGGIIPDFVIFTPRVGINVQGARFHTPPFGSLALDRMQRIQLEKSGLRMEFISEREAQLRADAAVRDAIAGTRGRGPLEALRGV